ncbi:DMT family transporter [Terrilactibacillus laevilacticus]|uniref:DMT family transporter n=1 Tax=Terrilactibacillus laevilacticus TaxID=1380157 RepID=A0ABW5PMX3_9BACI|nr:DMT family transporter [Terrilactibacillus laevilacticus]
MYRLILYGTLLTVVMIWGLNVTATKILVNYFPPVTMTALRIFVAGLSAILILSIRKKFKTFKKRGMFYIFLVAMFNVVGHQFFLSIGLTKTTASNTGILLGMVPLITSVLAVIFLGDRLTIMKCIGILIGFSGVTFIVIKGSSGFQAISIGDFYIFLSVLAQGISFVLIKKVASQMDGTVMTAWMLLFGSIILFFMGLIKEPSGLMNFSNVTPMVWIIFFSSAVLATGVGHMFYNKILQKIGAAEAAVFINFNPFFALIGAHFFLKEQIFYSQILGFLMVVVGVLFVTGEWGKIRKRRQVKFDGKIRSIK